MKTLGKFVPPKTLLTIVISALCLTLFQGMHTKAQTTNKSEAIEAGTGPRSEAFIELTTQLKQASIEIARLKGRLDGLESRERALQNNYRNLTADMTRLRDLTHRAVALKANDRKRSSKIKKVHRITGGRPGPKDMVVSINQFSITWNQIDTILDKLDEITLSF